MRLSPQDGVRSTLPLAFVPLGQSQPEAEKLKLFLGPFPLLRAWPTEKSPASYIGKHSWDHFFAASPATGPEVWPKTLCTACLMELATCFPVRV